MKLKKYLCTILTILILLSTINLTAFADNGTNQFKKSALQKSTTEQLQSLARAANNDAEATAVYEELLDRVENMVIASTTLIDTYLTHYSSTVSGRNIDVYYRVKALVPTGAFLTIGYEYPAQTRTSGSSTSLSGKAVGNYHAYYTSLGLCSYSRTYATFLAGTYSEKATYSTYLAANLAGTAYHTVTAADVLAGKIAITIAAVVTSLNFTTLAFRMVVYICAALTITDTWSSGPPDLVAGQYYKVYRYVSGGRLYSNVKVWHNYTAYQNDPSNPMYDGTGNITIPTF